MINESFDLRQNIHDYGIINKQLIYRSIDLRINIIYGLFLFEKS